ncbi:hypothetical protein RFI_20914 [Reticulomyxa filosa]|uniref:Uncharacterized protein n=1 Tax=Reticulomyxa filosa TaxID=46433 RepID=X6MS06_RETFI|nr:hypothetical protein RFI_20914 [Reticulomyxa filosa]|eukprot:ETO16426.1 hypothetical protein RFI_20914 [Reticulomyxa filosa]
MDAFVCLITAAEEGFDAVPQGIYLTALLEDCEEPEEKKNKQAKKKKGNESEEQGEDSVGDILAELNELDTTRSNVSKKYDDTNASKSEPAYTEDEKDENGTNALSLEKDVPMATTIPSTKGFESDNKAQQAKTKQLKEVNETGNGNMDSPCNRTSSEQLRPLHTLKHETTQDNVNVDYQSQSQPQPHSQPQPQPHSQPQPQPHSQPQPQPQSQEKLNETSNAQNDSNEYSDANAIHNETPTSQPKSNAVQMQVKRACENKPQSLDKVSETGPVKSEAFTSSIKPNTPMHEPCYIEAAIPEPTLIDLGNDSEEDTEMMASAYCTTFHAVNNNNNNSDVNQTKTKPITQSKPSTHWKPPTKVTRSSLLDKHNNNKAACASTPSYITTNIPLVTDINSDSDDPPKEEEDQIIKEEYYISEQMENRSLSGNDNYYDSDNSENAPIMNDDHNKQMPNEIALPSSLKKRIQASTSTCAKKRGLNEIPAPTLFNSTDASTLSKRRKLCNDQPHVVKFEKPNLAQTVVFPTLSQHLQHILISESIRPNIMKLASSRDFESMQLWMEGLKKYPPFTNEVGSKRLGAPPSNAFIANTFILSCLKLQWTDAKGNSELFPIASIRIFVVLVTYGVIYFSIQFVFTFLFAYSSDLFIVKILVVVNGWSEYLKNNTDKTHSGDQTNGSLMNEMIRLCNQMNQPLLLCFPPKNCLCIRGKLSGYFEKNYKHIIEAISHIHTYTNIMQIHKLKTKLKFVWFGNNSALLAACLRHSQNIRSLLMCWYEVVNEKPMEMAIEIISTMVEYFPESVRDPCVLMRAIQLVLLRPLPKTLEQKYKITQVKLCSLFKYNENTIESMSVFKKLRQDMIESECLQYALQSSQQLSQMQSANNPNYEKDKEIANQLYERGLVMKLFMKHDIKFSLQKLMSQIIWKCIYTNCNNLKYSVGVSYLINLFIEMVILLQKILDGKQQSTAHDSSLQSSCISIWQNVYNTMVFNMVINAKNYFQKTLNGGIPLHVCALIHGYFVLNKSQDSCLMKRWLADCETLSQDSCELLCQTLLKACQFGNVNVFNTQSTNDDNASSLYSEMIAEFKHSVKNFYHLLIDVFTCKGWNTELLEVMKTNHWNECVSKCRKNFT